MKQYSDWLKTQINQMGYEKANELLHGMWWNNLISVEQHCNIIYQVFNEYAYDCTFKQDWLDQYYTWLVKFEEEQHGR